MKKCFECRRPATYQHHVIPKSLGGTKTIPLCEFCHAKVHGEPAILTNHFIRVQKKKEGKIIWGSPPFGYRIEDEKKVKNEEEQKTISIMKELYEKRYTWKEIADTLNKEGHKSWFQIHHPEKEYHGWYGGIIKTILMREGFFDLQRVIFSGSAPYGYKRLHGEKVRKEKEQDIISLVISLREKGLPTKEIARQLNRQGCRKRGKVWSSHTVFFLLRNLGGKSGTGNPPYGYGWGFKKFIPMESEQMILSFIGYLLKRGRTKKEIVKKLNGRGYRTRSDGLWTMESLFTAIHRQKEKSRRFAAPFGYKWEYGKDGDKELIPLLHEQRILRIIESLYGKYFSSKGIIKELNRQGCKNRAGNRWKETKPIRQIVKREKFKRGEREDGGKKIHSVKCGF